MNFSSIIFNKLPSSSLGSGSLVQSHSATWQYPASSIALAVSISKCFMSVSIHSASFLYVFIVFAGIFFVLVYCICFSWSPSFTVASTFISKSNGLSSGRAFICSIGFFVLSMLVFSSTFRLAGSYSYPVLFLSSFSSSSISFLVKSVKFLSNSFKLGMVGLL